MKLNFASVCFVLVPVSVSAQLADGRPIRTDRDPLFGVAYPGWYGTESLAVQLPASGILPTTRPGALLAAKLPWRSAGYRPGTESQLDVTIENLGGGPVTAKVHAPTNEYPLGDTRGLSESGIKAILRRAEASTGKWRMLTGMDFPDAGCWQITGTYFGQSLTFVVETVVHAGASERAK